MTEVAPVEVNVAIVTLLYVPVTAFVAASLTYKVALILPLDWVNVALEPKELLSVDTSNPAEALTVISLDNEEPVITNDWEAEGVP